MVDLLPFSRAHFEELATWFANERDAVQWGGPSMTFPIDASQMNAMLEEMRAEPPTRMCWMARHDRELVGHAQLGLDWRNGNATLARVAIAPKARGRGLAAAMLSLVIADAFARCEIERVELHVFTFNIPAIRAYQRLGFKHEGVRRSSALVGSERWDTAIMAMLRDEWLG